MIVAGIDYSLTSPALCIGKKGSAFSECRVYCFGKKGIQGTYRNISIEQYPEWEDRIGRYAALAEWTLDKLIQNDVEKVGIEGYAYAARGRSTLDIAENGGILRYMLHQEKFERQEFAPPQVKKFASGKGNANKEDMYEAFLEETGEKLVEELQKKTETVGNPVSDIVDAYYVWKMVA